MLPQFNTKPMSSFNKRIFTILLAIGTVAYALLADKYNLPHSVILFFIIILFMLIITMDDDNNANPNMYTP